MSGRSESIRLRIGGVLAVLPIDAFTGKTILTRDLSAAVDGARPPVRKRDGFFVFSDAMPGNGKKEIPSAGEGGLLTVRLKGRGYRETVLCVPAASVSKDNPVLTVRMYPDESYPFQADTICIKGRLDDKVCLSAALLRKEGSSRIAEDYHAGGESIAVYQGGQCNLTGSCFYIEAGGQGAGGSFLLLGEPEDGGAGRYRLCEPLSEDYDRRNARLYPARMQKAGVSAESYFFAFHGGKEKVGDTMLCRAETAKGVREYRFFMESGETRVMDFLWEEGLTESVHPLEALRKG